MWRENKFIDYGDGLIIGIHFGLAVLKKVFREVVDVGKQSFWKIEDCYRRVVLDFRYFTQLFEKISIDIDFEATLPSASNNSANQDF